MLTFLTGEAELPLPRRFFCTEIECLFANPLRLRRCVLSRYRIGLLVILILSLASLPAFAADRSGRQDPAGRLSSTPANVISNGGEAVDLKPVTIVQWSGLGDGTMWSDPLNWNPAVVPGPEDAALIRGYGSPTVVLDERAIVWGLRVLTDDGVATLRIESDTLTLTHLGGNSGIIRIPEGACLEIRPRVTFQNLPEGLIELTGGDIIGGGTLQNSGSIVKLEDLPLRATNSRVDCGLRNQSDDPADGAIRVDEGTLTFTGGFVNEGSLTVNDMAQMGSGAKARTPSFVNNGIILLPENGELQLLDEAVVLENTHLGLVNLQGGDLTGAGTIANLGLVTKTGDRKSRANRSRVDVTFLNMSDDPGDGAIVAGDGTLALEGDVDNEGSIEVEEGGTVESGGDAPFAQAGTFTNAGRATVHPGGTWIQHGSLDNAVGGKMTNGGLLQIGAGGEWINDGETIVEEGAELSNLGYFHLRENSILGGSGVVESSIGTFFNEGIVRPGSSTGTLTFNGDFTQTETSEIVFELGGAAEGEYDQLVIGGNALLAGAIHARLTGSYAPAVDDQFDVIVIATGDKDTRSFGCYSGLDLPGGLHLEPFESPDVFSFRVTGSGTGNLPPRARIDYFVGPAEEPIGLPVLRNDTDPEGADLRVVPVVTATDNGGTVLLDTGDSTLTYIPLRGFTGVDRFRYVATDCEGGSDSAYVTVHVGRHLESVEEGSIAGKTGPGEEKAADGSVLFLSSPNPAHGAVSLRFERIPSGRADLSVYDVSGRLVRSFSLTGPSGEITWDGRTDTGREASPGVYFFRLRTTEGAETRRVLLVR